jgi:Dynamin central region
LTKVREVDPTGERTLGIITKPDKVEAKSGNEAMFLSLARNEDVFFQLGWHVIRNRKFDESGFSFDERNATESTFFRTSNFKTLIQDCVGIDTLRARLSGLLFEHIKRELPNLRRDLDQVTTETVSQLNALGDSRKTAQECRKYLTELSVNCVDLSKAAINGYYDDTYFQYRDNEVFSSDSPASIKRFRAVIQHLNRDFAEAFRLHGPKYLITSNPQVKHTLEGFADIVSPKFLPRDKALEWIAGVMERSRGKEPHGNYNPLIIGELFWEQTEKWQALAERHVDRVVQVCRKFFEILLSEKCSKDVQARLSALQVTDSLTSRRERAYQEVHNLMADNQDFPITYNHYYTDTIQKQQMDRTKETLRKAVIQATSQTLNKGCHSDHMSTQIDLEAVVAYIHPETNRDMLHYSCEGVLDCLNAMYKVSSAQNIRVFFNSNC